MCRVSVDSIFCSLATMANYSSEQKDLSFSTCLGNIWIKHYVLYALTCLK